MTHKDTLSIAAQDEAIKDYYEQEYQWSLVDTFLGSAWNQAVESEGHLDWVSREIMEEYKNFINK